MSFRPGDQVLVHGSEAISDIQFTVLSFELYNLPNGMCTHEPFYQIETDHPGNFMFVPARSIRRLGPEDACDKRGSWRQCPYKPPHRR